MMKFLPSRAHRWIGGGCTGSVTAEAESPRPPPSPNADEGNRLHALAAGRLTRGNMDEISRDDWRQISAYVEDVQSELRATGAERFIEQLGMDARVSLPGREIIWDYKAGFRPVEVVNNWQLLSYAIELDLPKGTVVDLRIVQPNGWHKHGVVRNWVVDDLRPYAHQREHMMRRARDAPRLVATPSNCRHCAAVITCEAARDVTLGAADLAFTTTGQLPPEAVRSELVTLRTASEMLKIRLDALEAATEAQLKAGKRVPGCSIQASGGGSLRWTADESLISATLTAMGVDPVPSKPVTPTQAIAAGVPESLVATMAKRNSPAIKLSTEPITAKFFT